MPARAAPRRHTYTHLGHTSSSSSFSSPCAVLCASFHPPPSSWNLEQVCSLADYCGPFSNSRHVKAIPGILLIVMQSRPRGKPNGIIILSRSRQCRGDCAADAPSVLFPLTHVTYATAARVARVQAGATGAPLGGDRWNFRLDRNDRSHMMRALGRSGDVVGVRRCRE